MPETFLKKLLDALKAIAGLILPNLKKQLTQLAEDVQHTKFRYVVTDTLSTFRSAGLFLFFNIAAIAVFTMLPQGRDILRIVAEDLSTLDNLNVWNLVWLLIGVFIWSVVSEYGTRYSIYVTDNSAKSLSSNRVNFRKHMQQFVAGIFLMLPYIVVIIGFILDYLTDRKYTDKTIWQGYFIPVFLLYILFKYVVTFYFNRERRKTFLQHASKNKLVEMLVLPEKELDWCNKLYGIYNDYIYSLPKYQNFNEDTTEYYFIKTFLHNVTDVSVAQKYAFPQSEMLTEEKRVPPQFQLVKFSSEQNNPAGEYKWIYHVPPRFYRVLHWQVRWITGLSLLLFCIICLMEVPAYSMIGAPGLVALAFACWSGLYIGILYADYCLLRYRGISLRFILFWLLIIVSFVNNDHPIRMGPANNDAAQRETLQNHFKNWLSVYKDSEKDSLTITDSSAKPLKEIPVFFVCAEGGALRTGGFTAMMLSTMQDSLNEKKYDFKKAVYAYTGVSGGSLGIGFFNAINYLADPKDLVKNSSTQMSKDFFSNDFLAPVIGKMFYGDILNLFIPIHIEKFDRAIALEKSWEDAWYCVQRDEHTDNIFHNNFLGGYKDKKNYPALFINTTEVETGLQCWISNVKPADNMIFSSQRDLLAKKVRGDIPFSTAINFSTRFPLLSPAANVNISSRKLHYVDGGYAENSGAATMLEILQQLKPLLADTSAGIKIKPYIMMLQFNADEPEADPKKEKNNNLNFGNEVTEILSGIYNTRSGRTSTAIEQLRRYVNNEINGKMIMLPLDKGSGEVPMNWVLSKESVKNIESDIQKKWKERKTNDLKELAGAYSRCFK